MLCPSCGNKNPEGVRFCIQCGAQMPVALIQTKETQLPTQSPTTPISEVLPAYRPFGIVFIVVYSVLYALTWFSMSVYAFAGVIAAQMRSPFDSPSEAVYLAFFISLFCSLLGAFSMTGALGLWILTRWGRNLVALLQLPNILLGILILMVAGSRHVREIGTEFSGLLVLTGLMTIIFAIAVLIYLLSGKTEIWFKKC